MKNTTTNSIFFCPFICLIFILCAQHSALGQRTAPAPYAPTTRVNYVRTWEATAPEQNPAVLVNRPMKDVRQSTSYFDGLGRLIQTVVKKGAMATGDAPRDLVVPVEYDTLGREQYKYLPFVANNTGGNTSLDDGNFKRNPFQQQAVFSAVQYEGESYYYGQIKFEASPLSRIEKTLAAGNSWMGEDRGVTNKFWNNTLLDDVKIWTVSHSSTGIGTFAVTGIYAAGTLFKNVSIDEAGNQLIEFKDKEGKIILKKVQCGGSADSGSGVGYAGYLNTYFIYDDAGNLHCVIQPEGVELIRAAEWALDNSDVLAGHCFLYAYDEKRRVVVKKIPGAGEVHMVYDARDRLVFTQDANLRQKGRWLATLYDALNRPVLTGFINYNEGREQLQHRVAIQTTGSNNGQWQIQGDLILDTSISSGSYYALNSITFQGGFETENGSESEFDLIDGTSGSDSVSAMIEGMAINRNPLPPGVSLEPLTFSYYDNYQWASSYPATIKTFETSAANGHLQPASSIDYPYPRQVQYNSNTQGILTGSKVRVLESNPVKFLTTVNFYDDNGRIIQTRSQNITNGVDVTTTQYSWSGQPLTVVQRHEKATPYSANVEIITKMAYDSLGRVLTVKKAINSTVNGRNVSKPEQIIFKNEYNLLGQLVKKDLGNPVIDSMRFTYNIRGWMLGVNRDYAKDSHDRNYFGFDLGYDKVNNGLIGNQSYEQPQYNGNVTGTVWKSRGDGEKRKFDYVYDGANRLLKAGYSQFTGSGFNQSAGLDFTVKDIKYDASGNIKSLTQRGWKLGGSTTIDSLIYAYDNRNKLKNVVDHNNDMQTTLGDFRSSQIYMGALGNDKSPSAIDYTYDANGNLITDRNKDIGDEANEGIIYNYLNQPSFISVNGTGGTIKGTISYTYDAAGKKLKKTVRENGQEKNTLYLGATIFENDSLQFITHEEGRIRYTEKYFENGTSDYFFFCDYYLKDQLGNVRVVLTEQKDTAVYMATMEAASRAKEDSLFFNIPETSWPRASVPNGYPVDNTTIINDSLSRLNGSGRKVGPSMVLKVMSGDKVDIGVKYFYRGAGVTGEISDPLADILYTLAGGLVGAAGEAKGSFSQLNNISGSPLATVLNTFRTEKNSTPAEKPKAYLNWILMDEQLRYVSASSGASLVEGPDQLLPLVSPPLNITKNGFLYIYVSNETPNWDVFFDNLSVRYYSGPMLEETHYYPFGLTIAGISSKALKANYVENKKNKFQDQEFNADLGVDMYEFKYRMHDPQIGRFWSVDPLAEKYLYNSVYAFSENKVTTHVELEGLEAFFIHGTSSNSDRWNEEAVETLMKLTNNKTSNTKFNWNAPLSNKQAKRGVAAAQLANHVMSNRVKGEEITLIGHSHGGNVAIQASRLIAEQTGEKVNIITIATPAYNATGDAENPETNKASINDHIALWNKRDIVSGGWAGEDTYSNSSVTRNVEVNVDKWYVKQEQYETNAGRGETITKTRTVVDAYGAHSFDVEHPESIITSQIKKLRSVRK